MKLLLTILLTKPSPRKYSKEEFKASTDTEHLGVGEATPLHAPKGDWVKAPLGAGSEMGSEPQGHAPRTPEHKRTCCFSPTASSLGFHERRGAAYSAKHTISWEMKQNFLSAL